MCALQHHKGITCDNRVDKEQSKNRQIYFREKEKLLTNSKKKIDGEKIFSIRNGTFMYGEQVVILRALKKEY